MLQIFVNLNKKISAQRFYAVINVHILEQGNALKYFKHLKFLSEMSFSSSRDESVEDFLYPLPSSFPLPPFFYHRCWQPRKWLCVKCKNATFTAKLYSNNSRPSKREKGRQPLSGPWGLWDFQNVLSPALVDDPGGRCIFLHLKTIHFTSHGRKLNMTNFRHILSH